MLLIASFRVQLLFPIPEEPLDVDNFDGLRSCCKSILKMGINVNGIIAARIQRDLQEILLKRATNKSGRNASPKAKPSVDIANAFPLCFENQRLIETTDRWDNIPCPERRKAKIAKGSNAAMDKILIKTDARLKMMSITITKSLALNLSAKVPA